MGVVEGAESAREALERADAAYASFDVAGIVANLSAAVRGFTAAGDVCMAATACVRLGDVYANAIGNQTAGRAWFTRARRLVADQPPCLEQGWAAVAAMGCDVDDPSELLAHAELALDRARLFGDVNLETKALADAGLARVQLGEIAAGMAMLDEAMALACGPASDFGAAAKSVCSFFTACYVSGEYERVGTWHSLLAGRGYISGSGIEAAFLSGHCDSVQAALLVEMGDWDEADRILSQAIVRFERLMGERSSWHPSIGLAELRLRQGRLDDAEQLLLGRDYSIHAMLPMAQVHLARGDVELARSVARRGVRAVSDDVLRGIELLIVLIDIELTAGDIDAARVVCSELDRRAADLDHVAARARANAAKARLMAADGDISSATALVSETIDDVDPVRLAVLYKSLDQQLGELRSRQSDLSPLAESRELATLGRDGKWWNVRYGGVHVRLPDTKGMRYLAVLVAAPGVERHSLDLVDAVEGVDPSGIDRRAIGDAGAVLDSHARTDYRMRIEALRSEIDEALEVDMLERAESLQNELDQLVAQLAAAFGLGGHDRQAASTVERARLNVTRATRSAIVKLIEAVPEAGRDLDRGVRTGTFCVYRHGPNGIRWIVQT